MSVNNTQNVAQQANTEVTQSLQRVLAQNSGVTSAQVRTASQQTSGVINTLCSRLMNATSQTQVNTVVNAFNQETGGRHAVRATSFSFQPQHMQTSSQSSSTQTSMLHNVLQQVQQVRQQPVTVNSIPTLCGNANTALDNLENADVTDNNVMDDCSNTMLNPNSTSQERTEAANQLATTATTKAARRFSNEYRTCLEGLKWIVRESNRRIDQLQQPNQPPNTQVRNLTNQVLAVRERIRELENRLPQSTTPSVPSQSTTQQAQPTTTQSYAAEQPGKRRRIGTE